MAQINIFVENTCEQLKIDEVKIYNDSLKMAEYLISQKEIYNASCLADYKFSTLSFDIVLVNNEEIHRINKEYRNKDNPTDVITFAIFADSPKSERFIFDEEINLGEIIISLDKTASQAEENNKTFNDELYFLISHGILHLLGFDHQNIDEYNFMIKYQNNAKAVVL